MEVKKNRKTPARVGVTTIGSFKVVYNAQANRVVYRSNGTIKEVHLAHPNPRGNLVTRFIRWITKRTRRLFERP